MSSLLYSKEQLPFSSCLLTAARKETSENINIVSALSIYKVKCRGHLQDQVASRNSEEKAHGIPQRCCYWVTSFRQLLMWGFSLP